MGRKGVRDPNAAADNRDGREAYLEELNKKVAAETKALERERCGAKREAQSIPK